MRSPERENMMLLKAICRTCLVAIVYASYTQAQNYETDNGLRYGGQFTGQCSDDGMFYMDENSYVMCSHSIAYIMPCAPGTKNSGRQLNNMQTGDNYGFTAFCDVNLVDMGFAAFHSQRNNNGNSQRNSGYGGGGTGGSGGYGNGGRGTFSGGKRPATNTANVASSYTPQVKQNTFSSNTAYSQQQPSSMGNQQAVRTQVQQSNPGYRSILGYGNQVNNQQRSNLANNIPRQTATQNVGYRNFANGRRY